MKKHVTYSKHFAVVALLCMAVFGTFACQNMSKTAKGGAIGTGAGAAAGAVVGKTFGNTTMGAIVGAAVGGATGALIGRRMDNQARELERELEGAEVERIGEGIAIKFDSGLLFNFDSDALLGNARANLDNLANSLKANPDTEILIVGHTDSQGSDSYNQGLSERRARSAASYLTSKGIASSRVKTQGRGEAEPIADNDTDAGRAENRRVEIAIVAGEQMVKNLEGN